MKPYATRGLLVLASVALVFLLAEVVLRLVPAQETSLRGLHEAEPDRPWLYALKPGARIRLDQTGDVAYNINRDGYRGPVASLEKPEGSDRILVIGDSLAFGYGVSEPETFPRLLASENVEVLNFGVGGYNPYNEAAVLREKGMDYDPDVVLVQFCVNDLNDPTGHFDVQTNIEIGALPDAAFPDPSERRSADAAPDSCFEDPCTCSDLCSRVRATFRRWWEDPAAPKLDPAAFEARELPDGPSRRWIGDLYEGMARTARAGGAKFAVVVFPYQGQVEGDTPSTLQEQLKELGRTRGFEVIDLLPAFRAGAPDEGLFLDIWHPTDEGHQVAAEAIQDRLQSLGWIGSASPP